MTEMLQRKKKQVSTTDTAHLHCWKLQGCIGSILLRRTPSFCRFSEPRQATGNSTRTVCIESIRAGNQPAIY